MGKGPGRSSEKGKNLLHPLMTVGWGLELCLVCIAIYKFVPLR